MEAFSVYFGKGQAWPIFLFWLWPSSEMHPFAFKTWQNGTYLNDSPVRQPEEAPVELPGAAEVNRVDTDVHSGATFAAGRGVRGSIPVLEVAAGATRLAGVVLPDVIRHCHLVKHSPPRPPDTHTHTGPPPPTKGTYLINFW